MNPVFVNNAWEGAVKVPLVSRSPKPRDTGITMVMDKGMGLDDTTDFISVAGRFVDYVKLAFGTSALYEPEMLYRKISLLKSNNIKVYPGGTFLEIAILQNSMEEYIQRAWEIGFDTLEVSDGTITLPPAIRRKAIAFAVRTGFEVLTEAGKKDPSENPEVGDIARQVREDLDHGAFKVILEARESGMGIGIFNEKGAIRRDSFDQLVNLLPSPGVIIWEAPLKSQQQELILSLGPEVNLGNIVPGEALALEALRTGLRGDTLKKFANWISE